MSNSSIDNDRSEPTRPPHRGYRGVIQNADPRLQTKLREMVDSLGSVQQVSLRIGIGREALMRYAGGFPMRDVTFRGIETTLRAVDIGCPDEWARQASGR